MPFRADAPFLLAEDKNCEVRKNVAYQCPFGLMLHFYTAKTVKISVKGKTYQCPFGLRLHFYQDAIEKIYPGNSINALSG